MVLIPAEEQREKIGEEKSEDATDEVCTVGYEDCRASTKADKRVKLLYGYRPCQAAFIGNILVCGEAPQEAAQDISDPEEGVDQHRLVVLVTHPVVLRQERNAGKEFRNIEELPHW